MSSERLLRIREVAGVLSVSRTMAYKLVREQAIPSVHIGTALRVRESDLAAYIRGLEPAAQAA